ncbi:Flagellar biosynthesis protein FliR [Candidatus Syntrophocurvum alkaliphilum]|uniref:Flagellar biosynthetic protein FliR n=1 Tax=Candidatus Syntrophocurvum alkaliphilum TaxID=2293317 RepID=A0A6I6DFK0_9FIRM|nr:flagellar biosynthetic protein FliR [Candidatus Syntrophocurvum alkaliphilum]QGT99181.1 Flagellar biosynthesis protein FliR [Candidatus Syntrophocurvum alkaliphilum]
MPFALEGFLMILGRLSGLFISAPVFNSRQVPGTVKVLIIVILSATMAYFVPVSFLVSLDNPGIIIAALVVEIFIGFTIGFVAYIAFAAIQLAGQLIDKQMGFMIVNVVDPQSGTSIPLMGNFKYIIALLLYLGMNGHHYLLQAIVQSYQFIPVMGLNLGANFYNLIIETTVYMFVVAIKIAAPVVMAILITDVSMGFIARTVPQMNVFIVGLPLKIFMGLVILLMVLPVYIWFMGILFARFFEYLDRIIFSMGL